MSFLPRLLQVARNIPFHLRGKGGEVPTLQTANVDNYAAPEVTSPSEEVIPDLPLELPAPKLPEQRMDLLSLVNSMQSCGMPDLRNSAHQKVFSLYLSTYFGADNHIRELKLDLDLQKVGRVLASHPNVQRARFRNVSLHFSPVSE